MTKRFNDSSYLEHMTDREIEKWKELRAEMQRIHNGSFLALISHYASYRKEREWELKRKHDSEKHIERMKHLPIGTEILAIRGEMQGETGIVKKHGRKYIKVVFPVDDRYIWSLPYTWITDDLSDKNIQRAKDNKALNDRIAPILSKALSDL